MFLSRYGLVQVPSCPQRLTTSAGTTISDSLDRGGYRPLRRPSHLLEESLSAGLHADKQILVGYNCESIWEANALVAPSRRVVLSQ
jgi:hypothetical protein